MSPSGRAQLLFETLAESGLLVSYQTTVNPTDAEWDRWLDAAFRLATKGPSFRLLAVTEGGYPSKKQIERLRARKDSNPLTALVSSSAALRFAASALAFTNPKLRCFSPTQLDRAFAHLGLSLAEGKPARETVARLRAAIHAGFDEASGGP